MNTKDPKNSRPRLKLIVVEVDGHVDWRHGTCGPGWVEQRRTVLVVIVEWQVSIFTLYKSYRLSLDIMQRQMECPEYGKTERVREKGLEKIEKFIRYERGRCPGDLLYEKDRHLENLREKWVRTNEQEEKDFQRRNPLRRKWEIWSMTTSVGNCD